MALTCLGHFRYGKVYLKAARSTVEKGADYAKKEIDRLQRMLEKVRPPKPTLMLKADP